MQRSATRAWQPQQQQPVALMHPGKLATALGMRRNLQKQPRRLLLGGQTGRTGGGLLRTCSQAEQVQATNGVIKVSVS